MASFSSSIATTNAGNGSKSSAARSSSISSPISANASKPRRSRGGDLAAAPATADAGKPLRARGGDLAATPTTADAGKPVESRGRPEPLKPDMGNAVLVPGDFRGVDVLVVDPQGEPIGDVDQLLVLNPFPSSTSINENGRGVLPCLSASYTSFRGLAGRSEKVGYTWYEGGDDADNVISPQDDSAVIVLDPAEIKGMDAGRGIDFGGNLSA